VFPFEVPTVFTAAQRADVREYIRAPIIAHEPLIRYRHDTLSAGLAAFGEPTTSPHRGAVGRLHKLICSSSERLELRLGSGDLLLINNHELLHGRTAFRDPNRLLLRVRFTRELRTREEGRGASG
jgi:alpha-ketoglutarate-dependent taurine dioxygenase